MSSRPRNATEPANGLVAPEPAPTPLPLAGPGGQKTRAPRARPARAGLDRPAAFGPALARLHDAVAFGVIVHDARGAIVYANRAAQRMLGLTADQLLGRTCARAFPALGPDGAPLPDDQRPCSLALRSGAPAPAATLAVPHPDGRLRWLEAQAVPVPGGRPRQVVCSLVDITPHRRALRGLTRKEARFRALVEQSAEAIAVLDAQGRCRYASPSTIRVLGQAADALVARPFFACVHPDDAQRVAHLFQTLLGQPGASATAEVRCRHRDGSWRWLEGIATNRLDHPAVHGIVVNYRDITDRKLFSVTQAMLHLLDVRILDRQPADACLQYVCDELAASFDYPLVWVALKEADQSLRVCAAGGSARAYLEGLVLRWDDSPYAGGPSGIALRTRQPCAMDSDDPRFAPWRARAQAHGLRSTLALPLLVNGAATGVLVIQSERPRAFDRTTVSLLQGFADQVALSLLAARHQQQLQLQTAALEAALNAVLIADRNGVIQWVNPAFTRQTGYAAEEVLGKSTALLRPERLDPALYRPLLEALRDGRPWQGELYTRRKDGSEYVQDATVTPVRDQRGEITHFVQVGQDATERREREEQVRSLATTDPLTGLPNRRLLWERLLQAVEHARHGQPSVLLLLDLDNFKVVNDSAGHLAGDRVLVSLARALGDALRDGDLLARLGGDEFAVLLPKTQARDGLAIAQRLGEVASDLRPCLDGRPVALGLSVGVAAIDGDLDAEAVLAAADAALYAAKEAGGNRAVLFHPDDDLRTRLAETGHWAARIRDALREDRLCFAFQPIVHLPSARPTHFEALLRLRDPAGQTFSPAQFLPTAERFGLMPQLDRWVVERAIRLLAAHPHLRLFVNLSAPSLADDPLLDLIELRLRQLAIPPAHLGFEVTESAAVTDLPHARHTIDRLKALGCRFALDDFGTGFASFAYLRSLPVDFVKIDGSFVRHLDTEPTNRALVEAMATVAHALGKAVIAEWVETPAVAAILAELGVEYAQGYLWGQPTETIPPPEP